MASESTELCKDFAAFQNAIDSLLRAPTPPDPKVANYWWTQHHLPAEISVEVSAICLLLEKITGNKDFAVVGNPTSVYPTLMLLKNMHKLLDEMVKECGEQKEELIPRRETYAAGDWYASHGL